MSSDNSTAPDATRSRLRFEAIFASAWIGFGLLVLPALIYWIGMLMLGSYGEDAGLGTFYLDYFRDLAEPAARAWALLLGPFATVSLLRLIFRRAPAPEPPAATPEEPPAPAPRRVEPRLGSD
jgi:hypothetical protein